MPLIAKPPRCPIESCRKRMVRAGETVQGKPVYSCPHCLTIVAKGVLKTPNTPRWKDEPTPRRRRRP